MALIHARMLMAIEKRLPKKLMPLWNHPAGLKTIHFWAPTFKWGLVIAGIADSYRPPEKLSFSQSSALGVTGAIWSRYSLVITPKNWYLFSVNLFLSFVGVMQVTKIILWRQQLAKDGLQVPPLI